MKLFQMDAGAPEERRRGTVDEDGQYCLAVTL
jgi:hypothetical protein